MASIMKYWPIALAVFAVMSGAITAQVQIKLNALEIADLSESIDEMELDMRDLRSLLWE